MLRSAVLCALLAAAAAAALDPAQSAFTCKGVRSTQPGCVACTFSSAQGGHKRTQAAARPSWERAHAEAGLTRRQQPTR